MWTFPSFTFSATFFRSSMDFIAELQQVQLQPDAFSWSYGIHAGAQVRFGWLQMFSWNYLWNPRKLRDDFCWRCGRFYGHPKRRKIESNNKKWWFGGAFLRVKSSWLSSDRGTIGFSKNHHCPDVASLSRDHHLETDSEAATPGSPTNCRVMDDGSPQESKTGPVAPVATFLVAAGPLQHVDLPKCCAERTGKGRQARSQLPTAYWDSTCFEYLLVVHCRF